MSKLENKISIPALRVLGIKEQSLTLQRFIYNNVFKNFWSDELSYEENFSINFDWYHPDLCSRHTLEEVTNWFMEENLLLLHTKEDDFGITARGLRRK